MRGAEAVLWAAALVAVNAARMLEDLSEQLAGQGVRMVLARGVGQVRDALRASERSAAPGEIDTYASVDEAVRSFA